jgi:serine protease Do
VKRRPEPRRPLAVAGRNAWWGLLVLAFLGSPLTWTPAFGLTPTEVYRSVSPSIVWIGVLDGKDEIVGFGSGVVVNLNGYVATNQHVIDRAARLIVRLPGGQMFRDVTVAYENDGKDIAILYVRSLRMAAVSFGDSDRVQIG